MSITDTWDEAAGQRWIEAWLDEDLEFEIGRELLELRSRIEAGEAGEAFAKDWWAWFRANSPTLRQHRADTLMKSASLKIIIRQLDAEKRAREARS